MIIGRVIFGLAAVPLMFTQFAFVADWFIGLNYTFAIGCMYSISLFSLVLENWSSSSFESVGDELKYSDANVFGIEFCAFSFVVSVLLVKIDEYAEKQLKKIQRSWIRISAESSKVEVVIPEKKVLKFDQVKKFTPDFWLNVAACMFQNLGTMLNVISNILRDRFAFTPEKATQFSMIPYFIAIGVSPFIGLAVDKVGNHLTWSTVGCVLCVLANVSLYQDPTCTGGECSETWPIISVCFFGLSISIYLIVSHGTLYTYLVDEDFLGTAFGIAFSILALSNTIFSISLGHIL